MSYRYFQKKNPSWPKKIGDVVGKKVRLKRQIETRGGEVFSEGLIMRAAHTHRGGFTLEHLTDSRATIRQVPPSDLEIVPEETKI
jgi:hypothetical protein